MVRSIVIIAAIMSGIGIAQADPDGDAIRRLLRESFDKTASPLAVEPVVVEDDHAVAGWSQGELGGRALLRKRHGDWSLVLCSGDGIRAPAALQAAGLPVQQAARLAARLTEAESRIAPERVALFGKFEGTLTMHPETGAHPPVHSAQMHVPATRRFVVGALVIQEPWLRATPGGAQVAGGYMRIINNGQEDDRLVGGSLQQAARFELHEMTMVDGVMRMRPLAEGIAVKAGQTVELKPGGLHVMGMGLMSAFSAGQTIKGSLLFEKAGTVQVEYSVAPIGSHGPGEGH